MIHRIHPGTPDQITRETLREQWRVNLARRRTIGATSVLGGAGVVGAAVLLASWQPSARLKPSGLQSAPMSVSSAPGDPRALPEWRGKPIFVVKRTDAMLNQLEALEPMLADPAVPGRLSSRLRGKPRVLGKSAKTSVLIGIAHLGFAKYQWPQTEYWREATCPPWLQLVFPDAFMRAYGALESRGAASSL